MDEPRMERRMIGAEEEELLDKLWEQAAGDEPRQPDTEGYADLQRRIRRRIRTKRIRRIAYSGAAAAAAAVAVLIAGRPEPAAGDAFEQDVTACS